MKEELLKLADALSEFSIKSFPVDTVASILYDLSAGISADEILEDLGLDDPGNYE